METKFGKFLQEVATSTFDTNTTSTGSITIQQTPRNLLRREGLNALKEDLNMLYGAEFDIVETKDGIDIVAENVPGDFTFTWELKSTIKSLDYDPFIEANNYEEDLALKAMKVAAKQREKAEREARLAEKRAKRLKELEDLQENAEDK